MRQKQKKKPKRKHKPKRQEKKPAVNPVFKPTEIINQLRPTIQTVRLLKARQADREKD